MEKQNEETKLITCDNEKKISFLVSDIYENKIRWRFMSFLYEGFGGIVISIIVWLVVTFVQFLHYHWTYFSAAMFTAALLVALVHIPLMIISSFLDFVLKKQKLKYYIRQHKYASGIEHLVEYHNEKAKYKWQKISEKEIRKLYAN